MCGITGIISLSGERIHSSKLQAMSESIKHRGPDGVGYFVAQTGIHHKRQQQYFQVFTEKKFVHELSLVPAIDDDYSQRYLNQHHWDLFFGHRRLAILDLSAAGFQPISDLSKKVWVTYNGEIYNFKELRRELTALGYEFFSNSDSEVLVYAYKEWGIECVLKLNGMFAFALWDSQLNKVYLVRDRYGIKPLYYTRTKNNQIIFASEVKSILAYEAEGVALDYAGLVEYFTFQNFFTDKTLFNDIKLLSAGNYLEIDLKTDSKLVQKQYWDFNFRESQEIKNEGDYLAELNFLFEQAVNRQLVSDVEVGSYLSGGIDSGAITAIAAKNLLYMKTFTVGFDLNNASGLELCFDERDKSEQLSYRYKTEHYEMILKSGDMERCLPKFSWHLEEPRVGQSYPNYYAAKLASKFVKVVFSGTGGDELFGGYPWRYYRATNNDNFSNYVDKYYQFWQRLLPNNEIKQLFTPIWDKVSEVSTRDIFESVFKHHPDKLYRSQDYINHSLYFEAKTFLHGLLVVEDKLSMAHSLETRVPLLDNDLVDFAQQLPISLKLKNLGEGQRLDENAIGNKSSHYYQKTNDGKLILRKALQKYLPEEYTISSKQGFSAPDNSWFKGDSIDFVRRTIMHENCKLNRYLDLNLIFNKMNDHVSGKKNCRLLIWSLINLEFFLNQYDF